MTDVRIRYINLTIGQDNRKIALSFIVAFHPAAFVGNHPGSFHLVVIDIEVFKFNGPGGSFFPHGAAYSDMDLTFPDTLAV